MWPIQTTHTGICVPVIISRQALTEEVESFSNDEGRNRVAAAEPTRELQTHLAIVKEWNLAELNMEYT